MTDREEYKRVAAAAAALLRRQPMVGALDLLEALNWLFPGHRDYWLRRHQAYPFLEDWMQSRRDRRVRVLRCFEEWAQAQGLEPLPQRYLPKTLRAADRELQVTPDGDPALEALYRLGFAKPGAATAVREAQSAASRSAQPPELVAFTVFREEPCQECGRELAKGDLVVMDGMRPVCLACADLDHLVFLPSASTAP